MTKRCIVNVAISNGKNNYVSGQQRLLRSIQEHDSEVGWLAYTEEYPPNSPRHGLGPGEVRYQFKYHALREAIRRGYEYLLWMDASCLLLKPIQRIWKAIEEEGVVFFDNGGHLQSHWTSKDCLDAIGSSIEEAQQYTQITGAIQGYNVHSPLAMWVLGKILEYGKMVTPINGGSRTSPAPGYRDHRHGQSCLSHLVYTKKIMKRPYGWWFATEYGPALGLWPETMIELRHV